MSGRSRRPSDDDAFVAWAETLRSGLGLVRFSDLPADQFDRLLSNAAHGGSSLHVAVAENATLEGLAAMKGNVPDTPEIRAAMAARRSELSARRESLEQEGSKVLDFPSAASESRRRASASSGFFGRLLSAFQEEPSALDDADSSDLQVERPQGDFVPE